MTTTNTRTFVYRSKCNRQPFSFRWEVEQLPFRLRSVGDQIFSPSFEAGPGIRFSVRLNRKKVDDEEWLTCYLFMSGKSHVKEATLNGFSFKLLRAPPKQDHKYTLVGLTHYTNNDNDAEFAGWGRRKFVRYTELTDPSEGFLEDGHLLTVLVEGSVLLDGGQPDAEQEIILNADESTGELETKICEDTMENFRKLFDESLLSDFVVKAKDVNGEEKELKVHRIILAAGSEVFEAMLSNPDVKECRDGIVEIEDIQFEVVEALIRFLYTGKLAQRPWEGEIDELGLLVAADKYRIDGLKTLVERRLAASLSVENVCGRLAHAERHKAFYLAERCIEFIRRRRNEVAETDGLQQLCAEFSHLMSVLFKDNH